ncbi:PTS sugar transporter subunit IIB [Sporolactobacillus terrae]|uniref:PTS sugar transporter subunit IIB n=1 Tax=Sporolactobacillus terrae TaxID=269673 RepID=UPI00048C7A8E|nr:PTS sugar transporter subunit IIB [Sporolactobacillus terrae]
MKIVLACAAGMSTSLLVTKMSEEAKKKGLDCKILATPVSSLKREIKGTDVVLLGPQVRYLLPKVKQLCEEFKVPVDVVPLVSYGRCDGKAVLEFANKLISN